MVKFEHQSQTLKINVKLILVFELLSLGKNKQKFYNQFIIYEKRQKIQTCSGTDNPLLIKKSCEKALSKSAD